MGALEVLVTDILCDSGLKTVDVKTRTSLELPGYYRGEKKWDLIVVSERSAGPCDGVQVAGRSFFGNNFNNRSEDTSSVAPTKSSGRIPRRQIRRRIPPAISWIPVPAEDRPEVHKPVRNREPYVEVDPAFKGDPDGNGTFAGVSYSRRS